MISDRRGVQGAAEGDDSPPEPPAQPEPGDCCNGGCERCVYDLYDDALERYREALSAWQSRHRDEAPPAR